VSLAIGCIWCASVLCSVLEIPSNLIGYELEARNESTFCSRVNNDNLNYELVLIIFIFIVLLCLIVIYSRICFQVRELVRQDDLGRIRHSHSFKPIITTFLIIGTFAFCWCPLGLFHVVFYIWTPDATTITPAQVNTLFLINEWLFVLLLMNSILNPIIYAVRRKEVRKVLRQRQISFTESQTQSVRTSLNKRNTRRHDSAEAERKAMAVLLNNYEKGS